MESYASGHEGEILTCKVHAQTHQTRQRGQNPLHVLSPDGIPIWPKTYRSRENAEPNAREWCAR
jgi:hypothetical protein